MSPNSPLSLDAPAHTRGRLKQALSDSNSRCVSFIPVSVIRRCYPLACHPLAHTCLPPIEEEAALASSTSSILRLTICPQVDKGSGRMWREEQSQLSGRRHKPKSLPTGDFPPFADFLQARLRAVTLFHGGQLQFFTVDCFCSEYDLALLCSPRRTVSFAVPTTTPTFLPSALSHLRGYVHCVSV